MTLPSTRAAPVPRGEDEISLFALASVLLQHRWRIAQWVFLGGLVAVTPVLIMPRTWTTRASFIPQGADVGQTGLRSLAGELGVVIPGGSASTQSPDFYRDLITSPVILGAIASDTIEVAEDGGVRRAVIDRLEIRAPNRAWAREEAIRRLGKALDTRLEAKTGVLTISVKTKWPSVSLGIAERMLEEVNRFNLQTRQSQAAQERRFVEQRLAAQRQSLVEAEARLSSFLRANRQFQNSPDLLFAHDRLEREVALQQQILVGLAQSFEEARIREVRDVPVITVIEAPRLPVRPDSQRLLFRGLVGALFGGFLGLLVVFSRDMFARQRAEGDKEASRFAALLGETRRDLTRWLRRRPAKK